MLDILFCGFCQIFTNKKKLVEWMLLAFFLDIICCSDYASDFFHNFPIAGRTMAVKLFALLRMLVRYLSVDDTFHFLLTSGTITDFLLVLFVCLV